MVRLHCMNRRPDQIVIDRCQIGLPVEYDVGGILTLINTPVILHAKAAEDGTECARELIQSGVDPLRVPAVGDLLGAAPVSNTREGVIHQIEVDIAFAQLRCQPVVAVEIDLQPAGQPCWNPHVAQSKLFVDEIEVVMQALAVVRQQVRFTGLLIVPRLVG